ncbi:MAG: AMP-binding protein [Victivallaceae bacterium]|nr:AMP-binding protein [Victivallaceae bacterium]
MMSHFLFFTAGAVIVFVLILPFLAPYKTLQILVSLLRHTIYTVKAYGEDNIPAEGPVLLLSNHVSIFDALMIVGTTHRRIHFMMHEDFFRMKFFNSFFRRLGVIEVPGGMKPKRLAAFLEQTKDILRKGEIVCVFPEGGVSGNGLILDFKKGINRMLPEDIDVPVIPIRLGMLWGSLFNFDKGKLRFIMPRCFPFPVSVSIGHRVSPELTPFQLRQLISEMGADAECEGFPGEVPLHYNFARRAKRHKRHSSFIDFGGKHPHDFEILVKALVLSRRIRALDGHNSEYIGVLLPNCTTAAAVVLAVLYADRTPAILNFTAGEIARNAAIAKASLRTIITSRAFLQKLGIEPTPEMVILEDLAKTIPASEKHQAIFCALVMPTGMLMKKYSPLSCHDTDRQAVLLFSSGSTGMPKGIMLTHHNLNSNFFSFWRIINWTPKDRTVGNLPLFHAYGFMIGMALPAVSGTPVVYIPNPIDAAGVCKLVETEKPTLLMATPTFIQHYMRKLKPHQFDSLRMVITGAEKLREDISRKFKEMTGLPIVEGFGCTELSPIVCINLSSSVFTLGRESGKPDSVGAPLPGIHVKIVDPETNEECQPGVPGLMLVKGALVMKGYLNDPEATAKVIDHGYYNTGDIASMSPDGYISITGRLSRFSKIAGEMVPHELVEKAINEVLESEERCVAVCGVSDPNRGEKLMVFYSLDTLEPPRMIEVLREKKIPNLWIPKAADFHKIDHLPLLGAGKLDIQKINAIASALQE